MTNEPLEEYPYDMQNEQTNAWLRRILDEQIHQSEQLDKIARASQLYFWLTLLALIVGICGPLIAVILYTTGIIQNLPNLLP